MQSPGMVVDLETLVTSRRDFKSPILHTASVTNQKHESALSTAY